MACLVALFALISTAAGAVLPLALQRRARGRLREWIVPLLGFFILPWTTFAYAVMYVSGANEVSGFEWFIVAFAFFIDLASWFGGSRARTD